VILGEMDDEVIAGDIVCGDNGEARPVYGGIEADGSDAATRDGGADGGSVPHAGKSDVIHILRAAGDFGAALLAVWRGADERRGVDFVWGIRHKAPAFRVSKKNRTNRGRWE